MNHNHIGNRRTELRPSMFKWIGNMSALADFLNAKPWISPWAIIKIINSYFRALGVVAFACNPFTGILIFCGMLYGNPHVAIASVMTALISIFTCKLIKAPNGDVCDGVCVFNSILVGGVLTAVLPLIYDVPLGLKFWIILAVAGFLTNFIEQGLITMMAPSRLPVQSVPFNLIAILVLLIYRTNSQGFKLESSSAEIDVGDNTTVDWNMVFKGTVLGAGQIYGVGNLVSSIFVWLGFFFYSPLLTLMFYVGSTIGAVLAVLYNVQPLAEIYEGLWSFNSLLATGGITFFIAPTPLCFLLAVVNGILAVTFQAALTPLFMQTSVPVFSCPFNVAIMFTLSISLRSESPLRFIERRTCPEEHISKHYELCGSQDFIDSESDSAKPLRIITDP